MKTIKDMTPEERGCNVSHEAMQKVYAMLQDPNRDPKTRPHIDRNGNITERPLRTDFEPI